MSGISPRRPLAVLGIVTLAASGLIGVSAGSAGAATTEYSYTGGEQTFVVPPDASVCAVTMEAAGANGGAGDFEDEGAEGAQGGGGGASVASIGGIGGTTAATLKVFPGDILTVSVGGVGGQGADQSQAGGFGGGGNGGNGPDPGPTDDLRGGGGGGATTIRRNGTVVLVAGGGGGGGAYNMDGGDGGVAAGDGQAGEAPSGNSSWGESGTGGTQAAGGTGGAPGGGAVTAETGAAGTALVGGKGGDGELDDEGPGGGGGGGGGWFGGGGGGGATEGGSGGGGGGGSSFAISNATDVGPGSVTQDADGNGAATITPVDTTCNFIQVNKRVEGVAAPGTTFTVHVSCTTGEEFDTRFDAEGAILDDPNFQVDSNTECTVTETAAGGAVSTRYECTDNSNGIPPAFCQPGGQKIVFGEIAGANAKVTVFNLMPASAAVVQPRFTG